MQYHLKKTRHSKKHTTTVIIALGCLFLLIGCTQVYEKLGLTPEQTADQLQADQNATTAIINQARTSTTEIITTTLAGLGAITSAILAKWLGTERKITKALITGIESANPTNIKETVKNKATVAGIEPILHKRVLKWT